MTFMYVIFLFPGEAGADGPLSVPPSPFLSEEIYLNCFKRAIEMALEAREREEREAKGFLENVEGKDCFETNPVSCLFGSRR